MIYFISDPHGGESMKGFAQYEAIRKEGDLLIVLGDLGLGFTDTLENRAFDEYFLSLPYPVAVVDGNHENFDRLYAYPEEEMWGGRGRRLSENAVLLSRGYVFDMEGYSFFVMGGCKSSAKWRDMGLCWPQEEQTEEEISRAYDSLAARGNRVDYVLTHKYRLEDPLAPPLSFQGLLHHIEKNVTYTHWYSGHWHSGFALDEKHTVVYDTPVPLLEKR